MFRILVESNDDKLYIIYNGGMQIAFESFQNLHVMLHEATACHITGELLEVLCLALDLVRSVRVLREQKEARSVILSTKDWLEVLRKLVSLLNTYIVQEIRMFCIEIMREFILIMPNEVLQVLVPLLSHCHSAFQDSHDAAPLGPHFPRRGHTIPTGTGKSVGRPIRPMVQMTVPNNQLDCGRVSIKILKPSLKHAVQYHQRYLLYIYIVEPFIICGDSYFIL